MVTLLDRLIARMNATKTVEELNAAVSREEVEALTEEERMVLTDVGHSTYLALSAKAYRDSHASADLQTFLQTNSS